MITSLYPDKVQILQSEKDMGVNGVSLKIQAWQVWAWYNGGKFNRSQSFATKRFDGDFRLGFVCC